MMSGFFVAFKKNALLPFLSFVFAFFIGGIIIVLSDPVIMGQLSSPGKFLTSAGSRIGNSYLAIFQGSIYDINLARESGFFRGFYPLSETIVTAVPLLFAGLAVALALDLDYLISELKDNLFLERLVLLMLVLLMNCHL